jgi:UDP-N-acetyl-D-mannosaminuronic acid dehydrogenase
MRLEASSSESPDFQRPFPFDVCVVGGCGHVGLPLSLAFARSGLQVAIYDIDERAVETVRSGRMPFLERGAQPLLEEFVGKSLIVSSDSSLVAKARFVIVVIGTPVDEHLNPTFHKIRRFFVSLLPLLADGQCLVLRSTVFPGTTEKIRELVESSGRDIRIAYCPERIAEGKALDELTSIPQIVSGCDERAVAMASELFGSIARSIIRLSPTEAELAKIFANVWRYIQFATSNQFLMIATDYGLDFYRIFDAVTSDYPRMSGLPRSGFAAGPCLFKDTMQLAAAANNNFALGQAAMQINEGLPNFVVRRLKASYALDKMRVGILGMAFKAESDNPRESLSYKLRKILEYECAEVLCTDVYIRDPSFLTTSEVIERSDILILGAPHGAYRALEIPESKPVIDIWNFFGKGTGMP